MTLVLVEVSDDAAVEALRRQQGVRVVGVVAATAEAALPPVAPPRKWAGGLAAISTTPAEEWDKHLHEIRNEWERDI
ncbi:hypothetical protein [Hymenobacter canadensis]|uniref:Uncharacterized protein n=1 Tax=Hymenobacter canadensis TaxID=2999067 RepID=A0ABY7LR69_9BACT|nr:hypothetical protein [Hymenobacter canadensis]WBA42417.1 hypothetical protein O3303_02400 [Hymenobacter canadensis]